MSDLQACGQCNTVYWNPMGQNECYVCGYTNFVEVDNE